MQNGCNKNMMELADYWILEKQLIHKLFNVLPSRYYGSTIYTNLYHSPRQFPGIHYKRAVLELKGNPFPSIVTHSTDGGLLIQNVLLNQAKKEYSSRQYEKTAENITNA
ncbi:hypothetical protein TSAR_014566 [Trichomalopsis sarcophagae]|uniref:39S ribosomal protein L17, mitochondrial n=1 Tax=Trichomalopsis sarcophagae TaxID=543379 RepID=A0A232ERS6_9HYME|nr:hypothetical protein TSAR_014566 [Trichomalopsis sarcophagae]